MARLLTLAVDLKAGTSKYTKSMKGAQSTTAGFSKAMKAAAVIGAGAAAPFAALAAGILGIGLAGRKAARALAPAFERIDKTTKAADKLGLSTEAVTQLGFAFEQTGNSADAGMTSVQRMMRRVSDASKGTGEAVGALKELNLNAKQLTLLTADQQLLKVADAMQAVKNQGDKVRLSVKLFDTEGVGLLNTLADGSEGLLKMMNRADALGKSFDRFEAAKIEAANDSINEMKTAFEGVKNTLAIELAPSVQLVSGAIADVVASGKGFGDKLSAAIDGTTKSVAVLLNSFDLAGREISNLKKGVSLGLGFIKDDIPGLKKLEELIQGVKIARDFLAGGPGSKFAGIASGGELLGDKLLRTLEENRLAAFETATEKTKNQMGGLADETERVANAMRNIAGTASGRQFSTLAFNDRTGFGERSVGMRGGSGRSEQKQDEQIKVARITNDILSQVRDTLSMGQAALTV